MWLRRADLLIQKTINKTVQLADLNTSKNDRQLNGGKIVATAATPNTI